MGSEFCKFPPLKTIESSGGTQNNQQAMNTPLIVVLSAIGFLILVVVIIYNTLVAKKNQVENSFATIDVMLKKRYDLIPQLVDAVKGYMKHEEKVLTEITELRRKVVSTDGMSSMEKVDINNAMILGMNKIFAQVEDYPDLKASDNFLHLQRSMNEVEAQLSAARRAFNAAVTTYNNTVESFPSNVIAKSMNYKRRDVFMIPETEKIRPNVDFSNENA